MKRVSKSRRDQLRVQRARDALPTPERAELHRQGAKAAARGEAASSNPMDNTSNMPGSTGEAVGTWQQRHDAWQKGHDTQTSTSAEDPSAPSETDDGGG
jgi:hypothetical protein